MVIHVSIFRKDLNYIDNKNDDILLFLQNQGIIDLGDVQEKMKAEIRKRYLNMHKNSIFLDSDGRWKTTVYDESKKNKRRMIAKKNKTDLEDVIVEYYSAIDDNKYISENTYTVESLFREWLDYKSSLTSATSYTKRISVDWNKYYKSSDIVKMPIKDLNYIILNKWSHDMIKKYELTKKQYYNMSVIMRQIFIYANELNIIDDNPFLKVRIGRNFFRQVSKPNNESQVFITDEQVKLSEEIKKRAANNKSCISPLIILLNFQLGLRIGELVAIKWCDITDDYIHIRRMEQALYKSESDKLVRNGCHIVNHTKSSAGDRMIYLNSNAKKILEEIRNISNTYEYYDDDFIYISSKTGKRGSSRGLSKYLQELCISCDIVPKGNHKIRKTQISRMFDSGININTIREQAGHEDERTSLNNYCFDQNTDITKKAILEAVSNQIMAV